jgi:hypothetical protein
VRQSASGSLTERFQQQVREKIAAFGEFLTVTRPGNGTTRQVEFLPQPLRPSQADSLIAEGLWNLGENMPHNFVCQAGSDVQERDLIGPYSGNLWRVLTVTPTRLNGVVVGMECVATRED